MRCRAHRAAGVTIRDGDAGRYQRSARCDISAAQAEPRRLQLRPSAEVKWLPEIGVTNRLNGDTVWFKLAVSFGANQESPLDTM